MLSTVLCRADHLPTVPVQVVSEVASANEPEVFTFDWFLFVAETNLPPVVEAPDAIANLFRDGGVVLVLDAPEPRLEIAIPRLTAYLLQPSSEAPFKAAKPEEKK